MTEQVVARRSSLARNIAYNLLGQAALLVLGLISVRYTVRRLGPEVYGVLSFAVILNQFILVALDLGISSTTTREVSIHRDSDRGYVTRLVRTATSVYYAAFVVGSVLVWFAAPVLASHFLRLSSMSVDTATLVLRILGVSFATALPRTLYSSVMRGMERLGLSNVIDVGTIALQQLGVVTILLSGGSLLAVVGWMAITNVVTLVVSGVAAAFLLSPRDLLPGFDREVIRRTARFSGEMTSISLLSVLHTQADELIVGKLLPVSTFGYYNFASNLAGRGSLVTGAISLAALPAMAHSLAGNRREDSLVQYRRLHDLVCLALLPVLVFIVFAGYPVLTFVFNAGVARSMLPALALLCLGNYMNATITIPYIFSVADDRARIALTLNAWALVAVIPISIGLVLWLGVVGAALSWVVYHVFAYIYMVPRVARACLEMTPGQWFRHLGVIVAAAMLCYGVPWSAVAVAAPGNPPWLLAGYVAGTLVFAAAGYRLMGVELRHSVSLLRARILRRPHPVVAP